MIEPPADQKKAPSHQDDDTSAERSYSIRGVAQVSQLRDDDEDDFHDLVVESERDERAFEIKQEIAEIVAESSQPSRSCLRETPLMRFWRSRRKACRR